MDVLFVGVPEIEIEVGHGCQPSVLQRQHVLNDCGAGGGISSSVINLKVITNQRMLFPEPATMVQRSGSLRVSKYRRADARFPWTHNKDVVDMHFHSMKILPWKNQVAVPEC